VIQLLAPPAGITIQVQEPLPTLETERVPLQQVFMNLTGNAVKYAGATRADAVIQIDWREVGDAFEFAVSDNGPGIDPEYHERIWGVFQTLESRDVVEGTGIGLSVVKKIVESRGGSVSVESMPGHGAAFRFTWPKTPRKGADV
jgi:signal transduction histidine kinase